MADTVTDEAFPTFAESDDADWSKVSADDEHVCDIDGCGRSFQSAGGLKRHQTRTHGTGGDKAPKAPAKARKTEALARDLEAFLVTVSIGVSVADATDGAIVANGAPALAQAWAKLAAKNPKVDAALRNLMAGSAYSEVVVATAMVVLPIMAHHNLLPEKVAAPMAGLVGHVAQNGQQ